VNEREYIQKINASDPEDLLSSVAHADAQEEQILRIYLGDDQFEQIRSHASEARETRAAAPPKGNVVVLHGIMGGELTETDDGKLIWVQVLNLLAGFFDRLGLNPDGSSQRPITPSGLYMRYYASLLTSLSRDWRVKPFSFDWRMDIRQSADALRLYIDANFGPDAPVNLVAHSMGGLVGRCYITQHQARWSKGGRLVMLGTPNYGSFAIPKLLLGTNDVLRLLNKIDIRHSAAQILQIACTFTGGYQMMPAKGHIEGLDILYKATTYAATPIDQRLLDGAVVFQNEIAKVVDPERMVYIAGYNRPTPAAIKNPASLASDDGYVLSKKGDGTVPHDLGLIDGVTTFFVDEEHLKLPANVGVQDALTEILLTGQIQNENPLFKGLSHDFDAERGAAAEDQPALQMTEAARLAAKEQQAIILRDLLASRGVNTSDSPVSREEMALADLMMLRDPVPVQVVSPVGTAAGKVLAATAASGGAGGPTVPAPSKTAAPPVAVAPRPSIRINVVKAGIETLTPASTNDARPIDCMAVGHYLRVAPGGAEHALDLALSKTRHAPADQEPPLLLAEFHQRGVLRGDLGIPFFLPDPRPGYEGSLIAVAGLGAIGSCGVPELSLVVRDLAWSLAQLGKKHLGTVLIASGARNLSVADTVHAFALGLGRALSNARSADAPRLEAVTFALLDLQYDAALAAFWREKEMGNLAPIDLDVTAPRPALDPHTSRAAVLEPGRIFIDFQDGVCRYSAITHEASIPERVFPINPKRIDDINARLLSTNDPLEKYKLGRFLLDFLIPQDLRPLLSGGAPIILMCNNQAAQVYWELAAQPLGDEELTSAPLDNAALGPAASQPYLGLQRGLTRQLRTALAPPPESPPPFGRVLRILVVANPCRENPLPGAEAEAKRLVELFDKINAQNAANPNSNHIEFVSLVGPRQATTLDVLLRVNEQPPFDVLHYAGHCILDEKNLERSGFLFSGDDRLTASDLDRVDRTPKFVFANACQSGVLPSRPDLIKPQLPATFAESFFKKGVANFICTAWPVSDQAASDFAFELYGKLLGADGEAAQPMYSAVRAARAKIAATPTWGAYQHYGDPDFRLFHPMRAVGR
jgi:pimeloyl-ACP methyl ester carboxylesterase